MSQTIFISRFPSHNKRDSARLDLLATMLSQSLPATKKSVGEGHSPQDSLAPLDERAREELKERRKGNSVEVCRRPCPPIRTRHAPTKQEANFTFPERKIQHETAAAPASTTACSPRSILKSRNHRPPRLYLPRTHGFTTLPSQEIKQSIRDAHHRNVSVRTQVVRPQPHPYAQIPSAPIDMGNKVSRFVGSLEFGDGASERSVARKPVRVLRKSSTDLLKRSDPKSPIPQRLTGTVLQVQQQVSSSTLDGTNEGNEQSLRDPFVDSNDQKSVSPDLVQPLSTSTVKGTGADALQSPSASSTIRKPRGSRRDLRGDSRSPFEEGSRDFEASQNPSSHHPPDRQAELSPSIPAPSPLLDDSPHKYGLKDRTDTPDIPEAEEIDVKKVRRRSNGIEIFNEAKSRQTAASFLNGLSTSRRRAESTQILTEQSGRPITTTRPSYSSRGATSDPTPKPQIMRPSDRSRGHNFKPSGFAYSRPLTIHQLQCMRSHARMLLSRNKKAPVECAVCHVDDAEEHFSCSWCALRMCRFCRKDFDERGLSALRRRIKLAELGEDGGSSGEEGVTVVRRDGRSCVY